MIDFKNVFSLEGKVALVVGAGGLGNPIASALMQNGADLIMADINLKAMEEVKAQTEAAGKKFLGLEVNLLDEQSINNMVAEAKKQMGRIDILVNAAGINILKKAEEYDGAAWDKVLGINLRGLHLTTSAVGKIMIEQGYGRILSISSVKAFIGTDQDYCAYCASKAGVDGYTRQLACEWGKYGITVNSICPGYFYTPLTKETLDSDFFQANARTMIPEERYGNEGELDTAAIFLASPASSYVTGVQLPVDGGYTCM